MINRVSLHLNLRELTEVDRPQWDRLNQSLASSCFMQSWAWSTFKQREGYQIFRYGLFADEKLVGGSIFYCYPQSAQPRLLVAPGAPSFLPGFEQEGMHLLLAAAQTIAQSYGAIALRIEPLLSEKPSYLQNFVRAPVDSLPSETLLIDLRPTEAEILSAMKPKGRYNIQLSHRHGVKTLFTQDSQAIPKFYDVFWNTVNRQQFLGEPYSFFINLCQILFATDNAEIGLATWHDQILAAVLIVYWGDRATYLYGGRNAIHPQVMASYGLHWAAMQRAKARGCRVYDFYGYTTIANHSYAKFSQFKRQFGGVPVTTIGAQDYFFYDRLADTLINILKAL